MDWILAGIPGPSGATIDAPCARWPTGAHLVGGGVWLALVQEAATNSPLPTRRNRPSSAVPVQGWLRYCACRSYSGQHQLKGVSGRWGLFTLATTWSDLHSC